MLMMFITRLHYVIHCLYQLIQYLELIEGKYLRCIIFKVVIIYCRSTGIT